MSMYSLLRTTQKPPTQHEIEESLAGNLCRCTGYRPILDAFRVFAKNEPSLYTDEAIHAAAGGVLPSSGSHKKGGVAGICPSTGNPCDCGKPAELQSKNGYVEHKSQEETGKKTAASNRSISTDHYGKDNIVPTKAEPIFPPELVSRKASSLVLSGAHGLMWYRPTNLNQLLDLKVRYPHAKLVGGNTEVGIETRFKNLHYPVLLAVTHVPELLGTKVSSWWWWWWSSHIFPFSCLVYKRAIAVHSIVCQFLQNQYTCFKAFLYTKGRSRNVKWIVLNLMMQRPTHKVCSVCR
jgi:xanthine dehydrogenase/oxidase